MVNMFFTNFTAFFDMIIVAFISVFLTLLFKGGPSILYTNGKFSINNLIWLFLIQFSGSIGVFMLSSYFFCSPILSEYKSIQHPVSILVALMPVELTLVLLIVLIHRIWIFIIKKVDPNFEEQDPLEKIKAIRSFYEESEYKARENLETTDDVENGENSNKNADQK